MDSHTHVVSADLIQTNLPAVVKKRLVQVSPLTMANMDVPQVIILAREPLWLGVVRVLARNSMGLVHIPLLSLLKIVPDLVCVLVRNNMGLIHVTHLALDHVVLDMANILVMSNLNHMGDVETIGNLTVAPRFVMKTSQ